MGLRTYDCPDCCGCEATEWVIAVCNSNAAVDDDFNLKLNGTLLSFFSFNASACVGPLFRTNSEIDAGDIVATIGLCCAGAMTPINFDKALLHANPTTNLFQMVNAHSNLNNNFGNVWFLGMYKSEGVWKVCQVIESTVYSGSNGDSFDYTWPGI